MTPAILVQILAVIACSFPGFSQAVPGPFSRLYKGDRCYEIKDAALLADGSAVMVGTTTAGRVDESDGWVLKVDANGSILWQKRLESAGRGELCSVHPTPDGGYMAVGYMDRTGGGASDGWIVKLSSAGNLQGQRLIGGDHGDALYSAAPTPDGGLMAVGTYGTGRWESHGWIVRLDQNGKPIWGDAYADADKVVPFSIAAGPGSGFSVSGMRVPPGDDETEDGWVTRLDANGATLWERTAGVEYEIEILLAACATTDDGIAAVGTFGDCFQDAYVVKFGSDGVLKWSRVMYASDSAESFKAVAPTPEGGLLAGGAGENYGWLMRFDPAGGLLWQKEYPQGYGVQSLRTLGDGSFSIVGDTLPRGAWPQKPAGWLMKVGPDGVLDATTLDASGVDKGAVLRSESSGVTVTRSDVLMFRSPAVAVDSDAVME